MGGCLRKEGREREKRQGTLGSGEKREEGGERFIQLTLWTRASFPPASIRPPRLGSFPQSSLPLSDSQSRRSYNSREPWPLSQPPPPPPKKNILRCLQRRLRLPPQCIQIHRRPGRSSKLMVQALRRSPRPLQRTGADLLAIPLHQPLVPGLGLGPDEHALAHAAELVRAAVLAAEGLRVLGNLVGDAPRPGVEAGRLHRVDYLQAVLSQGFSGAPVDG